MVSYLQKQNISIIDYMISSHYDDASVAGLVGCLDSFSVKNVIGADYVTGIQRSYQSFENSVAAQGLETCRASRSPERDSTFGRREIYGAFSSIDQQQR